jgi:hypothetical protein
MPLSSAGRDPETIVGPDQPMRLTSERHRYLFATDCYVMAERIVDVGGDHMTLRFTWDELIQP